MFNLDELNIRAIKKEDCSNIISLIEKISEEDNVEAGASEEELNFILDNPEMKESCYVAYLKNTLVAFGACFTNALEKNQAYLRLFVHPDFRRKGIGSRIYEIVKKRAEEQNCNEFYAGAEKSLVESVDFLKKRGFKDYEYLWRMELPLENKDFREIDLEGFEYTKISEEDINEFIKTISEGFKEEEEGGFSRDMLQDMQSNQSTDIYFLQKDKQSVATATVVYYGPISLGLIANIALYNERPDSRTGRVLMKLCLSKIQERGMGRAALEVSGKDESFLEFYTNFGFQPVETIIKLEKDL